MKVCEASKGKENVEGTPAGWRRHQRVPEDPCPPCRAAWNRYISQYRAKKGRR